MNSSSNLETRSLLDELSSFKKEGLFNLGHPLFNRMVECFVKSAGIGAIQYVFREAYFSAVEGENNCKSLEAMVKNTGMESLQWGSTAALYSGLTYSLKEARGVQDWKNIAVAGAITAATIAAAAENPTPEHIVQCAITGAAISTAANLLNGI
ncbi:outer envelope pore protein 16-2, chloroplastic-like [Abrus precatorius]|uniref:Outer envelope pore protein 16-2, chloroplastic-like n=1 Tax=Abrus precatorius TaxID=3816 RepID=A0A8B8MJE0_ABRPR|nr:outer envelope pore protein 16-2, chloroplastic-like [Abrus precatorius]